MGRMKELAIDLANQYTEKELEEMWNKQKQLEKLIYKMEKKKKQFSLSFITTSGMTILNDVVEADNWSDAIDQVKDNTNLILSCVSLSSNSPKEDKK
jgi:hypothetical protein